MGGDFFGHAHLIPSWSVKYVCESGSCSLQPDSMQRNCPHAGVFCESEYMHSIIGQVLPKYTEYPFTRMSFNISSSCTCSLLDIYIMYTRA